ncbi:hypothetical protein BLA29_014780, partial [Euroglyphus maynei]
MLSDYHNYFFTSLDLHTVDLEEFQYVGANISAFSLVDLNSKDFGQILNKLQRDSNTRYSWNGVGGGDSFDSMIRL